MSRRVATVCVVCAWMWTATFAGLLVASPAARADTSATCTTDTPTSYCEQLATGSNGGAADDGFVIALTSMGVLLGMSFGYIVLRKIFAAAGWGSW